MVKGNLDDYLDGLKESYGELISKGEDLYVTGFDPTWVLAIKKDLVNLNVSGEVIMTKELSDYLLRRNKVNLKDGEEILSWELRPYTKIGYSHSFGQNSFKTLEENGHVKVFYIDLD